MQPESAGKKRVIVNILDAEYKVITADSEDRVKKIASFVDQLINETKRNSPYMNNYTASVLSCLNLSEELFNLKDEVEVLRESQDEYLILSEYKEKLMLALQEAEANEAKRMAMQMKFERLEIENEELKDLLDDYKDRIEEMRTELELNKRTINELQNKLLENQIELVKLRKNFLNYSE